MNPFYSTESKEFNVYLHLHEFNIPRTFDSAEDYEKFFQEVM